MILETAVDRFRPARKSACTHEFFLPSALTRWHIRPVAWLCRSVLPCVEGPAREAPGMAQVQASMGVGRAAKASPGRRDAPAASWPVLLTGRQTVTLAALNRPCSEGASIKRGR